jgi:hypothetical protein
MDVTIRDLPVGAKFRAAGQSYELLAKHENRAHVQILLKPKLVRLPNGREFVRYRGRKVNISPNSAVEEVLD